MHKSLLILLIAIFLQTYSHSCDSERLTTKYFKGVELYSWLDAATDAWFYSLLPGTNRVKTLAEITNPKRTIKDVEELKRRLGHLAVGEYVTWNSIDPTKAYPLLPPERIVDDLAQTAKVLELNLYIPKPRNRATAEQSGGGRR